MWKTGLYSTGLIFVGLTLIQAERPTSCPGGFTRHGTSCYAVFGQTVSWIDAQSYCDKFGSDLLRIDSQQEATAVNGMLLGRSGMYWLDANDLLEEGVWRYSGRHGDKLTFTQWRSGSPDNAHGGQDCAVLYASDGRWDDVQCTNGRYNFICEIQLADDANIVG